eukprot:7547695-Pyramimonas_sp.AAC.1
MSRQCNPLSPAPPASHQMLHQCYINVAPMSHQCNPLSPAPPASHQMYHQCTINVPSMYHQCHTNATRHRQHRLHHPVFEIKKLSKFED